MLAWQLAEKKSFFNIIYNIYFILSDKNIYFFLF